MSHAHHRDRSSRQNYQSVDWEEQFAAFEQQATWDEYFRLRRKILEVIASKDRRRDQLWDQLDQLALPLITPPERVIAVCKAFELELQGKSLQRKWYRSKWLRHIGLDLIKYAWELPERPSKKLALEVLKQEDGKSETLREAADLLQKGYVPPKMSDNDTLALLLWVPAKYFREAEAIKLAKQLRQALPDGHESEIEALWQELALLLRPKAVAPASSSPQSSRARADVALEQLNDCEKTVTQLEADLAQRDKFINVLQDQIRDDKQKTQQARQEREIKIKRGFMQELAEPLNQLQLAVASNKTEELTLICESFTLALQALRITPIGEIDRQFTVSQKDSVKPRDHKSVMEQNVQQTTLGWKLHLSNSKPRVLVKPEVKRLETTHPHPDPLPTLGEGDPSAPSAPRKLGEGVGGEGFRG